jgi:hypothetical protein
MKISLLITALSTAAVSAATVSITTLADLEAPSETINTTGQKPTYQNRTVDGVAAIHTKDATFAASIDFKAGNSVNNGVIWESGGATIGSTLSYNQAAATLSVHHSANSGNALGVVTHKLTDAQVTGGNVEVVWAYDASEIEWELFVNGFSSGTTVDTTGAASLNDWSGGNLAGLGIVAGNSVAGNGSNGALPAAANLGTTASIDLGVGLKFWAGTDAQFIAVPEPSSIALLGLASLFAMRRQRR